MIINNSEELISSGLRATAVGLIEAGISRVLPANLMREAVKYSITKQRLTVSAVKYSLAKGRVFVIGGGKASGLMAEELEWIMQPGTITAGTVNCKTGGYNTEKVAIVEAGHPVPDESGMRGVREMLAMKARYNIGKGDLVICLISGGGSSLLPCPMAGVTLEAKQAMTQLLLRCGADIREINTVRKHLSMVKGGGLAAFYEPARMV